MTCTAELAKAIYLEADYQDECGREYRRWLRRTSSKPYSFTRDEYVRAFPSRVKEA